MTVQKCSCVNCKDLVTANNINKHYARCLTKGKKVSFHSGKFCQFCNKECATSSGRGIHETRCKNNPSISVKPPKHRKTGQIAWNKGLTKDTDKRVMKGALTQLGVSKPGHLHTEEDKDKMRQKRIKKILEGSSDSSGRKGFRGYYNGMYFHSSWELAYFVYETEVNQKSIFRNHKIKFEYSYNGNIHCYIPDFVDALGRLIEIKGRLYSDKDVEKYNQTKDKAQYLFREDIQEHLRYCINKYGKEFYKELYTVIA